ncbi:MAG TPA: DUF805 domain-containing protein [Planctomycetaceae bacterium]|nr:DUF805 domain-containing protein [Planctomycetaceae bacterium]
MNDFVNNYVNVVKNALNFEDRTSRREYWMFFAANFAIAIALCIVDGLTGLPILSLLYMVAMLLPGIAAAVRRLHDTGRSGWWMLAGLVPIVGPIGLLVLMVLPGTAKANEFGAPPMTQVAMPATA